MASKPAVLVTRPAAQAGPLCEALEARGFTAFSEPMLELVAAEGPGAEQRRIIEGLPEFQHIIFISGNAVRFGMDWLRPAWPELPREPQWHAIGEVTARALREEGLTDVHCAATMTSEGLLQALPLRRLAGQRVLIVKGVGGRDHLREQLAEGGAEVRVLCCYRRRCPPITSGQLRSRLLEWNIALILVSSGEGLCNMLALLSPCESSKLAGMPLIVPSKRVAGLARDRGFSTLITAANASDAAMLQALEGWWQTREKVLENDE